MATLTNASAGTTDEFGGDEFSNNLFSDLAPLLTLFGEQVTKQFLSMSLGWADNILLAMGPLGIMTIIVSAIRVGGVRQLKAMVGRARESQSTAEQELLSSTSADVCELWSGKEVVRLIGSPAGMKNLVIVGSKGEAKVLDIAAACREGFMESPGLEVGDPTSETTLGELSEAAPNLGLNVKNATAKPMELWVCAAVGVVLQAAAMVFPGLATYHWKLEKAGAPVPAYGYPCFLIGTLLVITGVAACGHVIEGITTEHYFTASTKGDSVYSTTVKKVVRLQRSCTVSDQHFASFAIHNSADDLDVRTSRLNNRDYSTLAATATIVAVVGFIAQFIGLRALHWSATIFQLGVTLVMTGIRAYVRRGLATNPICSGVLDGHEAAWLAMQISQNIDREAAASTPTVRVVEETQAGDPPPKLLMSTIKRMITLRPDAGTQSVEEYTASTPTVRVVEEKQAGDHLPRSLTSRIKRMITSRPGPGTQSGEKYTPMRWELPSLRYSLDEYYRVFAEYSARSPSETGAFMEERKLVSMFLESRHPTVPTEPLRVGMNTLRDPAAREVELHASIQALMPRHDDTTVVASKLAAAIERVTAKCASMDAIKWSRSGSSESPAAILICLPVVVQTLGYSKLREVVRLRVSGQIPDAMQSEAETPNLRPWVLDDRDQLKSVLSLWNYTLAEREKAFQEVDAILTEGWTTPFKRPGAKGTVFVRVVGSTSEFTDPRDLGLFLAGHRQAPQQDWLGKRVLRATSSDGILAIEHDMEGEMSYPIGRDWPVFGAFVSELSSNNGGSDYYIYTDQRTGLVMQCAHEILSIVILTIASMIEKVGGETTRLEYRPTDRRDRDRTRAPRTMVNSIFRELAQEIVDADMAHDITEAYTLVIPAFDHYGLLPTRADNDLVEDRVVDAAQMDDEYRNDNFDGGEGGAGGT